MAVRGSWLALIVLLMACQTAGPAASPEQQGTQPTASPVSKRIVTAVRSSPQVLFYQKLNLASAGLGVSDFEKLLAAGLTLADQDDALRPQLAEAVPTLENGLWKVSPDGRMETT